MGKIIQIKHNQTGIVSPIDSDIWERNKEKYKRVFTVVTPIAEPPEVKKLREKKAGGKKANQQPAPDPPPAENGTGNEVDTSTT